MQWFLTKLGSLMIIWSVHGFTLQIITGDSRPSGYFENTNFSIQCMGTYLYEYLSIRMNSMRIGMQLR